VVDQSAGRGESVRGAGGGRCSEAAAVGRDGDHRGRGRCLPRAAAGRGADAHHAGGRARHGVGTAGTRNSPGGGGTTGRATAPVGGRSIKRSEETACKQPSRFTRYPRSIPEKRRWTASA